MILKKKIEITDGAGVRLGEIPRVELHLQKLHADELKPLHRLLFDKLGAVSEYLIFWFTKIAMVSTRSKSRKVFLSFVYLLIYFLYYV